MGDQTGNQARRPNPLYPLSVICPQCGTGHLDTPGDYGRCRKCLFPLGKSEPDYETARADLARAGRLLDGRTHDAMPEARA